MNSIVSLEYFICILICGFIGLLFTIHFIYLVCKSKASENWVETKATIIKSNLDALEYVGGSAARSYKPNIAYKYYVMNNEYVSKRIFYGSLIRTNTSKSSKETIHKYKKGDNISIYYNPNNPSQSVIERGINPIVYRSLLVVLISLIVILLLSLII